MASKLSSLKRKAAPKHAHDVKRNPRKVQKVTKTQQIDTFPSDVEEDDVDGNTNPVQSTKGISSETSKVTGDAKERRGHEQVVEEVEEDDQTAALLKGFESSSDEEVGSGDEEEDSDSGGASKPVPALPKSKALQARLAAAAKSKKSSSSSENVPGVVYIGRIPHGFYEQQMRAYFSQFGDITRLRLSRNRRTGASKHYAFVEFASAEVASIVASTMDNYLIRNHLLKVKRLTPEQVHPDLFKDAHKRFHKIPWTKIERLRANNVDRAAWQKRVERERSRRDKKAAQMKALGYEFNAPALRQVEDVPVQKGGIAASDIAAAQPGSSEAEAATEDRPQQLITDGKETVEELLPTKTVAAAAAALAKEKEKAKAKVGAGAKRKKH